MRNLKTHLGMLLLALAAGISVQYTKIALPFAKSLPPSPKAIGIHIGLNFVDPHRYENWDGRLNAAEYDAKDMAKLTSALKFTNVSLLSPAATRGAVIKSIQSAAATLKAGDLLVITYSGHGGQVPDGNNDEADDHLDETWCLYDGELIDDELNALWATFAEGVRILVISDSCHSGTVIKFLTEKIGKAKPYASKNLPTPQAEKTYAANKAFYDKIQDQTKVSGKAVIKASVKLISGCQDSELSYDGDLNGVFTGALRDVWAYGNFSGNYDLFTDRIKQKLTKQTPGILNIGQSSNTFNNQKPFTL